MATRILLVDDHDVVRQGIGALIAEEGDFELVGEASDGREAVRLASELTPDVVIMDTTLPELNGIEATRRIVEGNGAIKVLMLSMHADKRLIREALRAGAAGYIGKRATFGELAKAIQTVMDGEVYLSPSIAKQVVPDIVRATPSDEPTAAASLTAREREILQLIAEGHSVKNIGGLLGISVKTVSAHRRNIMAKLGLAGRMKPVDAALVGGLAAQHATLAPLEYEVLQLTVEGLTAREIGRYLEISVDAVTALRRKVMVKLDAASTADLVKLACLLPLTTQEREVLQLMDEGIDEKGIARLLGLTVDRVSTIRQRITRKHRRPPDTGEELR